MAEHYYYYYYYYDRKKHAELYIQTAKRNLNKPMNRIQPYPTLLTIS